MKTETVQEREHRLRWIEGETYKQRYNRLKSERYKNDDFKRQKRQKRCSNWQKNNRDKANERGARYRKRNMKKILREELKEAIANQINIYYGRNDIRTLLHNLVCQIGIKYLNGVCPLCKNKMKKRGDINKKDERHVVAAHYIPNELCNYRFLLLNLMPICDRCNKSDIGAKFMQDIYKKRCKKIYNLHNWIFNIDNDRYEEEINITNQHVIKLSNELIRKQAIYLLYKMYDIFEIDIPTDSLREREQTGLGSYNKYKQFVDFGLDKEFENNELGNHLLITFSQTVEETYESYKKLLNI